MKRMISLFICCILILLPGCSAKYKRISFNNETLGEKLAEHIDEKTMVVNSADESLPDKLPIYKISERNISEAEYQQMLNQLGIEENIKSEIGTFSHLDGNKIELWIRSVTDESVGDFSMTNGELEKLAWEKFNKISFLEGDFEYLGIKSRTQISTSEGDITNRVGVSFCRTIDGIRIVGDDRCDFEFDNLGLVQINIKLYNYEKIGSMDLVSLKSASSRIKNPDAFSIYNGSSESKPRMLEKLQVEEVKLWLYNQYSDGCTILEPVYDYIGTATDIDGKENRFSSKIIAIPDSYTYVKKSNTSEE